MPPKKREPTEAERQAQSNTKMRTDVMRECATEVRRIKAERKDLNEQMADIRERLDNCGVNKKAFEHAVKLADMEDDAARDDYLDGLREAFGALGVGEQLDFLAASEDTAAADIAESESDVEAAVQ